MVLILVCMLSLRLGEPMTMTTGNRLCHSSSKLNILGGHPFGGIALDGIFLEIGVIEFFYTLPSFTEAVKPTYGGTFRGTTIRQKLLAVKGTCMCVFRR